MAKYIASIKYMVGQEVASTLAVIVKGVKKTYQPITIHDDVLKIKLSREQAESLIDMLSDALEHTPEVDDDIDYPGRVI